MPNTFDDLVGKLRSLKQQRLHRHNPCIGKTPTDPMFRWVMDRNRPKCRRLAEYGVCPYGSRCRYSHIDHPFVAESKDDTYQCVGVLKFASREIRGLSERELIMRRFSKHRNMVIREFTPPSWKRKYGPPSWVHTRESRKSGRAKKYTLAYNGPYLRYKCARFMEILENWCYMVNEPPNAVEEKNCEERMSPLIEAFEGYLAEYSRIVREVNFEVTQISPENDKHLCDLENKLYEEDMAIYRIWPRVAAKYCKKRFGEILAELRGLCAQVQIKCRLTPEDLTSYNARQERLSVLEKKRVSMLQNVQLRVIKKYEYVNVVARRSSAGHFQDIFLAIRSPDERGVWLPIIFPGYKKLTRSLFGKDFLRDVSRQSRTEVSPKVYKIETFSSEWRRTVVKPVRNIHRSTPEEVFARHKVDEMVFQTAG